MTHEHTASHKWGLAKGYRGADHAWHPYSADSIKAVETALETHLPVSSQQRFAGLPATAVVEEEKLHYLTLSAPQSEWGLLQLADWEVHLEDGSRVPLRLVTVELPGKKDPVLAAELPSALPQGYHRLVVISADVTYRTTHIIVTPSYLQVSPNQQNVWGLTTQIYALRGDQSWSMGDSHDLKELCCWAAREGADFVSINPIHAGSTVAPVENSPYLPRSRRYLSVLMLAVEDLPEYQSASAECRAAIDALAAPLKTRNQSPELLDRSAVHSAKMAALELLFSDGMYTLRLDHFEEFCQQEGSQLRDYALWCALVEEYGEDHPILWENDHGPSSAWAVEKSVEHAKRIKFHQWVQFLLTDQLQDVQRAAKAAGMSIGIVHDLAVGVGLHSADVWSLPSLMVPEVTVGAPPDAYNQLGQNWNQPPWHPKSLQEVGYAPFVQMIRKLCETGGGVRIDHILGLFRLWWIPRGMPPTAGVYVPFPYHDLLRIVVLEAHRHSCVIIGEDLGTVEDYVREALCHYGIWGTSVLWYEYDDNGQLRVPETIRRDCMMTVSTHDMPPVSAYLAGKQVDLRDSLGILGQPRESEWQDYLRNRADIVEMGTRMGVWPSDTLPGSDAEVLAIHQLMWLAPATAKAISLADIVTEQRSENVPGTDTEYPNWLVPLCDREGRAVSLQQVQESPMWAAMKRDVMDNP